MIKWLLLTLFIINPISFGVEVVPTPIKPHITVYNHILKNKPNLDPVYADRLAWAIYSTSNKYKLNPLKVSAILRQECRYLLKCINDTSKDYGIGQINHKTIKAFNFDKNRLLVDLDYSVEAAVIVLADFKRMYGRKEVDYWTRYNASNPQKREVYKQLVVRFL